MARLQESIRHIKANRAMEERYMIFEEMLRDEYSKGKAAGRMEGKVENIFALLEELGDIPGELRGQIMSMKDAEELTRYLKLAARAASIEEFREGISEK